MILGFLEKKFLGGMRNFCVLRRFCQLTAKLRKKSVTSNPQKASSTALIRKLSYKSKKCAKPPKLHRNKVKFLSKFYKCAHCATFYKMIDIEYIDDYCSNWIIHPIVKICKYFEHMKDGEYV